MYPTPKERKPNLWSMADNSELTKLCLALTFDLQYGNDDEAKEKLELLRTAISTCPSNLADVKNFEIVGASIETLADSLELSNAQIAQLKRDLSCISYFCYSSQMRYYECVCDAIQMRAELMMSKREQFNSIIRSILHIVNGSIFEEKRLTEGIFNKMVFADLSYAHSQGELDVDFDEAYRQLKLNFANTDNNNLIREGDALHKRMFDTLKSLYLTLNEFSYLSLE